MNEFLIGVWIVMGVLAYGLSMGWFRAHPQDVVDNDWVPPILVSLVMGVFGLVGLLLVWGHLMEKYEGEDIFRDGVRWW